MTTALCFSCGETKWGAWCPCSKCRVASSGNKELDIAFSDHHLAASTLEQFGAVVKAIAARSDEPAVRMWAFLTYVSENHGSILTGKTPEELREEVERVLGEGPLPAVTLEESLQSKMAKERAAKTLEVIMPEGAAAVLADGLGLTSFDSNAVPTRPLGPFACRVTIRLRDGREVRGGRVALFDGKAAISADRTILFEAADVRCVRREFSMFHPFVRRRWVMLD